MKISIRLATLEDAREILEIYTPYIKETTITFEYRVPTLEEFQHRMRGIMRSFPYLVAVGTDCKTHKSRILGYAYAHELRERIAYQWSVETSIYIRSGYTGMGIGKELYGALLHILKAQGIQNAYGCVTLPNPKSQGLHEKLGFELVGKFSKAGYKLNKWLDVGWFELILGEHPEDLEFIQGNLYHILPPESINIEEILKEKT